MEDDGTIQFHLQNPNWHLKLIGWQKQLLKWKLAKELKWGRIGRAFGDRKHLFVYKFWPILFGFLHHVYMGKKEIKLVVLFNFFGRKCSIQNSMGGWLNWLKNWREMEEGCLIVAEGQRWCDWKAEGNEKWMVSFRSVHSSMQTIFQSKIAFLAHQSSRMNQPKRAMAVVRIKLEGMWRMNK